MVNPEKLAKWQNTRRKKQKQKKTQHNMCWTPEYQTCLEGGNLKQI